MTNDKIYISEKKLSELKAELEELKTKKRREIAERINEAKDLGDLSENAEYQQARDEQGFIEGRIIELENTLKRVEVVDKFQTATDAIRVGSKIRVQRLDTKENEEYEIVGSQEADPFQHKISNESPLGKAFLGKKKGETVQAALPGGERNFKILEIV